MILAPTTYCFFASTLPVIAFSEQPCVNNLYLFLVDVKISDKIYNITMKLLFDFWLK